MMTKFISAFLLLPIALAWSMSETEEAMLLNQELQYLEETAANTASSPLPGSRAAARIRNAPDQSLERTYFGEDEEDIVETRTAAPRRRSTSDEISE